MAANILMVVVVLLLSPHGFGQDGIPLTMGSEHSSAKYSPINVITVNGCNGKTENKDDILQEIRDIRYLAEALKTSFEESISKIDESLLQDIKGWWIAMVTSVSDEGENGIALERAQDWWDSLISAITTTPCISGGNGPPLGTIQDWFIAMMTSMMDSSFYGNGPPTDQIREWWIATMTPMMDTSSEDEPPVKRIQDWFISMMTPMMGRSKDDEGPQNIHELWTSTITSWADNNIPDLPNARDCYELKERGETTSGIYSIQPDESEPFEVYCDMETDGGGWTVIQRREDGSVNFYVPWESYKLGLGSLDGEFWLGNDKLHYLSNQKTYQLRVDLEDFDNNVRYALYDSFAIGDASDKYRLELGSYSGDAGDAMTYHNGQQFSTFDQDNDLSTNNCAFRYKGAWWYNQCHHSNLNGQYLEGHHDTTATGVNWYEWRGHNYSLKFTELKLRPVE